MNFIQTTMGYSVWISTHLDKRVDPDELSDAYEELNGYPPQDVSDNYFSDEMRDFGTWLPKLSEKFPGVLFTLEWTGEEDEDMGRAFARDGKYYEESVDVIYPKFNEAMFNGNYVSQSSFNNKLINTIMEKIELSLKEGTSELEIRTGAAAIIHEPESLDINGTLSAPADFLKVRSQQCEPLKTHVVVNEDEGLITLIANDQDKVGYILITGKLTLNPEYVRTGVNTGNGKTAFKLAQWIKMNRTLFDTKEEAARLVTELRSLKLKVDKQVEENEDDRANKSMKIAQAVESNLPEGFNLTVPLFVGEKAVTFAVEVVIDPEDFSCSLLSPDASDAIKKEKSDAIQKQLKNFSEYVVIYQ